MTDSHTQPISGLQDWRHLHFKEVESTNDICLSLANNGEPGQLWVTAESQTSGRGSRGRDWESGQGNLFSSLLFAPDVELAEVSTLSGLTFVTSLALASAIEEVGRVVTPSVKLKWPNDVLLNGKKCAGILLESHTLSRRQIVVIGCGVNCVWKPEHTNHPATSFLIEGIETSAQDFFVMFAHQMAEWIKLWDNGSGFPVIRERWLDKAARLGQEVRVSIPTRGEMTGVFETIDENGLFVLRREDGTQAKLSSADIFV